MIENSWINWIYRKVRVAEIIKYPIIAQNFGSDSRRRKGRIVILCNLFHNAENLSETDFHASPKGEAQGCAE